MLFSLILGGFYHRGVFYKGLVGDSRKDFFMKTDELYDLVQKSFDRLENRLISIENRLRDVERTISENKGRQSGLVTAKDVFVVLCGIAAVVISLVRLSQN